MNVFTLSWYALAYQVLAVVLLGLLIRTSLALGKARKRNDLQGKQWARDLERWTRRHFEEEQLLASARLERDNAWARLELIAATMLRRPPRRRWLAIARKVARVSCGYLCVGGIPALGETPEVATIRAEMNVDWAKGPLRGLTTSDMNAHARDA